jgi:glycosyltransferase involved in cell wall biosynthesis
LRLCFIADGISLHTQRWTNYFAGRGHEVHLISSRLPERSNEGFDREVHIHSLARLLPNLWRVSGYLSGIVWLLQVRKLVREITPDILHAHYIQVPAYLAVAADFHPLVLTAWGNDILVDPEQSRISRFLVEYCLKKADLITCESEHLSKRLIGLGANPTKINLICWGVDTQRFSPGEKDEKLIEALGIANAPIIISTRTLDPIYDVESLIESIPLVLRDEPKAKFLIVGKGSQETKLKRLATSLGVADSTVFTGYLPNDELPRYLRIADVYVSTSLSDGGLSLCTAEAMACELPVVITDFGDNRKWVDDYVNGFLVPLRDTKALASKILYLLSNREERIRFGQANRKKIEDRKALHKEMLKVEACYQELLRK